MRTPLVLALIAALGLFGCSSEPDEVRDASRWTEALVEAIEPLPHVAELQDVSYAMQGPIKHTQAWVSGSVWSDSDDDAVNRQLLDEVGRAVATALAENPVEDSWVSISVVGASGKGYDLALLGLPETPTLDDLAQHYSIPRQK